MIIELLLVGFVLSLKLTEFVWASGFYKSDGPGWKSRGQPAGNKIAC